MNEAKIQFSDSELALMQDANIILMKNAVMQKIKTLLEDLQGQMLQHIKYELEDGLPDYFLTQPKISRGEQYNGLPYLILDYPRIFQFSDIFALRSMFWWGHYYSSTLHLSGVYKERFIDKLELAYPALSEKDYHVSINEDQWQHSFHPENYVAIASLSPQEFVAHCHRYDHLKIACPYPLEETENAGNKLFESWKLLLTLCMR